MQVIQQLSQCVSLKRFKASEVVFLQGSEGDYYYVSARARECGVVLTAVRAQLVLVGSVGMHALDWKGGDADGKVRPPLFPRSLPPSPDLPGDAWTLTRCAQNDAPWDDEATEEETTAMRLQAKVASVKAEELEATFGPCLVHASARHCSCRQGR